MTCPLFSVQPLQLCWAPPSSCCWPNGAPVNGFILEAAKQGSQRTNLKPASPEGRGWSIYGATLRRGERGEHSWKLEKGEVIAICTDASKLWASSHDTGSENSAVGIGGAMVRNPPANAGDARDARLILESGRSPGEGQGRPLQYSCLGHPMDREAR